MNDLPQRERESELKEILLSVEDLCRRYDGLTVELRNKIQAIHNPSHIEKQSIPENKIAEPTDFVGKITMQIETLKNYSNRLEYLLGKMHKII